MWSCSLLVFVVLLLLVGCASSDDGGEVEQKPYLERLKDTIRKLRPLHSRLGPPRRGDWLAHHPEPGQTFAEFLASDPLLPQKDRKTIYIQPLGEFTETQKKIIGTTADFISIFFNLPVKVRKVLPLSLIPAEARRTHPVWGDRQILTTYVLYGVLRPRLPADAAAYIAFTTSDLWPGEGWNFVFGEASLRERVGVWSLYRYGDPHRSEEAFRLCLLRTLKTAVHEVGHMFSMLHCTAFECGMCGSNSLAESDRRPLWFCPECSAKVCWLTKCDPYKRLKRLADFCKSVGLKRESKFYNRSAEALHGE